ncbi:response regulator [Dactylosporangium sp. CS-033363]|uniref:response regulator n=1 Tax=Dactylosporangium sp. CS-033363 TaxID=3239935 RepID=UPI003D8FBEAB
MRAIVADDAVLLRSGVVAILGDAGFDVVAAVGTGPDLVAAALRHEPGLVVADVRMPPTHSDDGIVAVREIRRSLPGTAVVLLSQYVEAERAVDLFQEQPSGLGYLLKDRVIEIDDFLAAVHRVAAGGSAIDPAVVARLIGRPQKVAPLDRLTDRERDVLALMAEGLSNGAIGERLYLGLRTVETHVNGVFTKLGLFPAAEEHRRVKAVLAYLSAR